MTNPLIPILESLQTQAYVTDGGPRPADLSWLRNYEMAAGEGLDSEAVHDDSVLWVTRQAAAEARQAMPTRFEDPASYSYLSQASLKIEHAIGQLGLALQSRPLFATLPTGRVEPVTVCADAAPSDHLVLFESQFVVFGVLLAKAVVAGGEQQPEALQFFADLVIAYATSGRPGAISPVLNVRQRSSTELSSAMFLFAVAHEYAHAVLGHLAGCRRGPRLWPLNGLADLLYTSQQELDADLIGVRLAVEAGAQAGVELRTVLCGAELFLSGLELMDRTVSLLRSGDETASQIGARPRAAIRRTNMRELVARIAGPDAAPTVGAAIAAVESQEQKVERLWSQARPMLAQSRAERAERTATANLPWQVGAPEDEFTHGE